MSDAGRENYRTITHLTRVEPDRLQVQLDDGSCCLVLRAEAESAGWEPGVRPSPTELGAAITAERLAAARQQAFTYLSRRSYSRLQLSGKLARAGFGPETATAAVNQLVADGYVDDAEFALLWVQNRLARRQEGRALLVARLRERGVSRETAHEVVDQEYPLDREREAIARLLEQLGGSGATSRAARASVWRRLQSRGFSFALISSMVGSAFDVPNEED